MSKQIIYSSEWLTVYVAEDSQVRYVTFSDFDQAEVDLPFPLDWKTDNGPWNTHGCTTHESGKVIGVDEHGVTYEVTGNWWCSSCWQTGCNGGPENNLVGNVHSCRWENVYEDQYGCLYCR